MADTNRVILTGRLVDDPDVVVTQTTGKFRAKFRLAVNRIRRQGEEEAQADFINITAWEPSSKFLRDYAHKGDKILIEGRIQTGSYQKQDGTRAYTTDVIAERVEGISLRKNQVQPVAKEASQPIAREPSPQIVNPWDASYSDQIDPNDLPF